MHDRRRRPAGEREAVEDLLEVVHQAQMEPEQVAVLAGDAVAENDLRRLAGDLGDAVQLARDGSDPDDDLDREADRPRLDLRVVADDDAAALEPLDALRHRGW